MKDAEADRGQDGCQATDGDPLRACVPRPAFGLLRLHEPPGPKEIRTRAPAAIMAIIDR